MDLKFVELILASCHSEYSFSFEELRVNLEESDKQHEDLREKIALPSLELIDMLAKDVCRLSGLRLLEVLILVVPFLEDFLCAALEKHLGQVIIPVYFAYAFLLLAVLNLGFFITLLGVK